MHWFSWFDRIVAHLCTSRQHEAPSEGHGSLSRTKDENRDPDLALVLHRTEWAGVWAA